jgi:hypothetical protein
MPLDDKDVAQINDMIKGAVVSGLSAYDQRQKAAAPAPAFPPALRTTAEIGSPEFAEDRTQVNSLNNKWIFESAMSRFWEAERRSNDHLADLQSRGLQSFDNMLQLQEKVNEKFFSGVDDRARIRDQWNYVTSYDLSNPNTLGTSDNVRGGVIPQNRAIDTATAQSTLNNTTLQTAIEAAVANALNGTIPTLEAAIGAAVAAALVNTPSNKATGTAPATA